MYTIQYTMYTKVYLIVKCIMVIHAHVQGSVLEPCFFLIYINDIDPKISGEMLKFADDNKVMCPIEKEENGATLQVDLDRLVDWSNKWQMQFNI